MSARDGVVAAWDALRARPLAALLVASAALKLAYVFLLTRYSTYLFSDFAGYWNRAHQRLAGGEYDVGQWAFSQPVPHILLSWYLRLVGMLGLSAWELEAALVANVAASTASVALLYGIALRTLGSRACALAVAALYAFSFPLVYLNAFVMSEHGAVLFMLAGLWLTLREPQSFRTLAAAGAVLGLAAAMRPPFGVLGLPMAAYLAFADRPPSRATLVRAGIFSLGFFVVVVSAATEVHRISQGRLFGLSASGEQNFYFAQCRPASVSFNHLGRAYSFTAPSFVNRPEYGSVHFDLPAEQQGLLRALAWRCMKEEPDRWGALSQRAADLFFGPLLPSTSSAAGFTRLLPPFRWFLLGCVLLLPLAFAARRAHGISTRALSLIAGMLAISVLLLSVFTVEHRYLYPLVPLIYVLLAGALLAALREPRRMAVAAAIWAALLAAFGLAAAAAQAARSHGAPPAIRTEIRKFASPYIASAEEHKLSESTVRRLYYPEADRLWPRSGRDEVAFALHRTCMDVRTAGLYELQVIAGGGFTLLFDGRKLLSERQARLDGVYKWRVQIPAGKHLYAVRMDGPIGVTATWRRLTSQFSEFSPGLNLHYVGESAEEAVFLPPERC